MGQQSSSLPGGWKAGDIAYYASAEQKLESGDVLTYGARGQVVGPSLLGDGSDDSRVAILLPGNAKPIACFISALSRSPPPQELPGGWQVGDLVVYTGSSRTLANNDRTQTGARGRVLGPASEHPGRVAVLLEGNEVPVATSNIARDMPPSLLGLLFGSCHGCYQRANTLVLDELGPAKPVLPHPSAKQVLIQKSGDRRHSPRS